MKIKHIFPYMMAAGLGLTGCKMPDAPKYTVMLKGGNKLVFSTTDRTPRQDRVMIFENEEQYTSEIYKMIKMGDTLTMYGTTTKTYDFAPDELIISNVIESRWTPPAQRIISVNGVNIKDVFARQRVNQATHQRDSIIADMKQKLR